MLGEIISGDERQDMGLEAFEIVVVEDALFRDIFRTLPSKLESDAIR